MPKKAILPYKIGWFLWYSQSNKSRGIRKKAGSDEKVPALVKSSVSSCIYDALDLQGAAHYISFWKKQDLVPFREEERMKIKLIYPRWKKLDGQTTFNLPPHGPAVFSAALPDDVEIEFIDENLESVEFVDNADIVGISMMLTTQVKRGWKIADRFSRHG